MKKIKKEFKSLKRTVNSVIVLPTMVKTKEEILNINPNIKDKKEFLTSLFKLYKKNKLKFKITELKTNGLVVGNLINKKTKEILITDLKFPFNEGFSFIFESKIIDYKLEIIEESSPIKIKLSFTIDNKSIN